MHIVNTYTHNGAIVYIPIEVSIKDTCIIYRDISKSLDTSYSQRKYRTNWTSICARPFT